MSSRFASFDSVTLPPPSRDDMSREAWIYTLTTDALTTEDFDLFESWLDADECQRLHNFTFKDAARLFIAAHGFTRFALSHWQSCHTPDQAGQPDEWVFEAGQFGKPVAHMADTPDIAAPSFSLSHTRGAVAVAITRSGRIGVDIEWQNRQVKQFDVSERYFTVEEQKDIISLKSHQEAVNRFLLYWTLKEAYLKALGFGLTKGLKSFAFKPEESSAYLLYDRDGYDGEWVFLHYRQPEGYVLAVAIEVVAGEDLYGRIIAL